MNSEFIDSEYKKYFHLASLLFFLNWRLCSEDVCLCGKGCEDIFCFREGRWRRLYVHLLMPAPSALLPPGQTTSKTENNPARIRIIKAAVSYAEWLIFSPMVILHTSVYWGAKPIHQNEGTTQWDVPVNCDIVMKNWDRRRNIITNTNTRLIAQSGSQPAPVSWMDHRLKIISLLNENEPYLWKQPVCIPHTEAPNTF